MSMNGQSRVIIEGISPAIDGGLHFAKAVVGENVHVEADLYTDGHDVVFGHLCHKYQDDAAWSETPLNFLVNDRWAAQFTTQKQGFYQYKVIGWVDYALNWHYEIGKKIEAKQDVAIELLDGIQHLENMIKAANKADADYLKQLITLFADKSQYQKATQEAKSQRLKDIFTQHPQKDFATQSPVYQLWVDRRKGNFSAWYEFFPRSAAQEKGKHGTLKDCERLLPRVAKLGFDTLYFPPIHPIGVAHRKGKNNATDAQPDDVGSPWAIADHKAIHKDLGTMADFESLVKAANKQGIEIAMDFAMQCAPEHPYLKEHPEWFRKRPDGSIQYAENPPKKYQDIYPFYFECEDWQGLWNELLSIALFWVEKGIRVFRVDNPHTKPFRFWQWLIAEVHKVNKDIIFLAEAFTRPKIMHQLAKVGFTQSYSYYTWRNTKQELIEYVTELTKTTSRYYFRPNFWPNTPDINPWALQNPTQAVYLTRFFMAATLSSNYGVYGPVYDYMEHHAIPGKEEYLDSEKYETRLWDWDKNNKLLEVMRMVNTARRENEALTWTHNIEFCAIENPQILAYFKQSEDGKNNLLAVVNLDPYYIQSGSVKVPLHRMGMKEGDSFSVNDLLTGISYRWDKEWNYVELNPNGLPFHLFKIER